MKKIVAIIMLTCVAPSLFALNMYEKCEIQMYKTPSPSSDPVDEPEIGQRIPSMRITCSIDYDNSSVSFFPILCDDPVSYEIWTEDISLCYYASDCPQEFVDILRANNSSNTIIIKFENYWLIGSL